MTIAEEYAEKLRNALPDNREFCHIAGSMKHEGWIEQINHNFYFFNDDSILLQTKLCSATEPKAIIATTVEEIIRNHQLNTDTLDYRLQIDGRKLNDSEMAYLKTIAKNVLRGPDNA